MLGVTFELFGLFHVFWIVWFWFFRFTVLEPSGIPVTGTPSISLISNFINRRWTLYIKLISTISAHFPWNRWRTCYHVNNMDGIPVTGIPDGSRTDLKVVQSTLIYPNYIYPKIHIPNRFSKVPNKSLYETTPKICFPYPNLHFWTQFAIPYVKKFIYQFWECIFMQHPSRASNSSHASSCDSSCTRQAPTLCYSK